MLRKLFLLSILVLVAGCASGKKAVQPSPEKNRSEKPASPYDESFDPLSLNDSDLTFPEKKNDNSEEGKHLSEGKNAVQSPQEKPNQLIDGFRVQLLATKDIERATVAKKEAEFAFGDSPVNVYIEFDSPYYKLRIGDCQTREQAEALRDLAQQKGYPSPWIVRTRVWSNPQLPEPLSPGETEN